MEDEPRFTVVVPTRDRPRSLAHCLSALERQDVSETFEIVVVDDGSREAAEVAAVVASSPRARLVRTAPSGSAPARNRGIREARAPVVLLVDDDCEPRRDWAAVLTSAVEDGAAIAAGRSVNADPRDVLGEATQTVLDYITLQSLGPDGRIAFAPTYNVACPRRLLLDLPFDERYVNSGADRDWCARLAQRGHRIALQQEAIVDHRQTLDLRAFWLKHYSYGEGSARFRRNHGIRLERPGYYLGLLRAGFRRGTKVGFAVCLAQLATAVGLGAEALAQRRA